MNKFKFYFILLIATASIFSCSKSDNTDYTPEPLRDYQTQYNSDIQTIKTYLQNHYISVIDNPGFSDDQDVTISKLIDGKTSIWDQTKYPLLNKTVTLNGVNYTLYYLVLRKGTENSTTKLGGISPCNVDGVFAAYKGTYLFNTTATATTASEVTATTFEDAPNPNTTLSLFETITGWGEVFPEFKTGSRTTEPKNGVTTYTDFGAGVMFLPSGLAYYNNATATIPSYSPLVFSFKLYDIQRLDQDKDGIPSYLEDLNRDNYLRVFSDNNPDDTDKDGIPDFVDIDDDGDNYTTRLETQYVNSLDPNKTVRYYPFNGVSNNDPNNPDNDPLTPYVDESKGIPAYTPTGLDYTTPGRVRIHVDKDHH